MNKEYQHIFDDVKYTKKQKPEEPIRLFITGGTDIGKIFILMFFIQIFFYNRHPNSYHFKNKPCLWCIQKNTTHNINGATIHSSISLTLIAKTFYL